MSMKVKDIKALSSSFDECDLVVALNENAYLLSGVVHDSHDKGFFLIAEKINSRHFTIKPGNADHDGKASDAISRWRNIGTDLLGICADGMEELIAWGKGKGAKR